MSLTSEEQDILDTIRGAMPHWFTDRARAQEDLYIAAKSAGIALEQIKDWFEKALILEAPGATSTEPDWLNQHARDRGTSRQNNETDVTLAYRLRHLEESVTRAAILAAVNQIMLDVGAVAPAVMVELPRDGAYFIDQVLADTDTGGVFSGPDVDNVMTFTPTVPFRYPPWNATSLPADTVSSTPPDLLWSTVAALPDPWAGSPEIPVKSGRVKSHQIIISGAANAANDGTFPVSGIDGSAVKFANAAGVAGADPTVTWSTQREDVDDQVIEGFADSFFDVGDRMMRRGWGIIIILPYLADVVVREATRRAVAEMLRKRKAAGVYAVVETNTTVVLPLVVPCTVFGIAQWATILSAAIPLVPDEETVLTPTSGDAGPYFARALVSFPDFGYRLPPGADLGESTNEYFYFLDQDGNRPTQTCILDGLDGLYAGVSIAVSLNQAYVPSTTWTFHIAAGVLKDDGSSEAYSAFPLTFPYVIEP